MNPLRTETVRIIHPYAWVWEPLAEEPGFVLRSMFGAKSVYFAGRIMLCCSAGEEPWRGILVCTEREHHASLCTEFPQLKPHPILGKWLYVSEGCLGFERLAGLLVRRILERDPRIGVIPPLKRRKASLKR